MQYEMFTPFNQNDTTSTENLPKLDKPTIVGYMSVDVLREYHHNISQLKYLTHIPSGRLHLDLNNNIEHAVKRTTDDNDEKITLLLKFILDQKIRLNCLRTEDTIFICYRRSLISIMCNIYNKTPISIVASLYNKQIYLYLMESSQEVIRRKANKEQDKFCAWGYKFEQYMLSDLPNSKPDIEKPVIENEEFSVYYYTQLGNHRLFYGAQIDGMMATRDAVTNVPSSDDVEGNLNFLKNNSFVELKTQKLMYHRQQVYNFKRHKLLRCWCQCFLAGLQGLLVGYRNDEGIIQAVEWFDTAGIVRYCKGIWSPQTTLNYLNTFLNFVKESFNSIDAASGEGYDSKIPLTLKFDINEKHNFTVSRTVEKQHIILPSWYIDSMHDQQ